MIKIWLLAFVFVVIVQNVLSEQSSDYEWNEFKKGRRYANDTEEKRRRSIFYQNLEIIKRHNELYMEGKTNEKMAPNGGSKLLA